MFNYIIGKVVDVKENSIVLENNNIGFDIYVSTFSQDILKSVVEEVKVYTYFQLKEDGVSLFGFLSLSEKNIFLKLISVSGVGPKGAMAILSNIKADDLSVVIAKQDLSLLSKIKGVGKKTAERILVELKDKIDVLPMELLNQGEIKIDSKEIDDACEVLISLGISKQEAYKLAESCFVTGDTAEEIIAKALSKR